MTNRQPATTTTRPAVLRWVEISLWLVMGGIALLQTYKIKMGVVTAQGADVVAPALLYMIGRRGKSVLRHIGMTAERPLASAVGLMLLCCGWEAFQKLHFIPGVFDWMDIAAYAVGIGGAYLIDRAFTSVAPDAAGVS